jgi:hypothetical protein
MRALDNRFLNVCLLKSPNGISTHSPQGEASGLAETLTGVRRCANTETPNRALRWPRLKPLI